MNKKLVFLLLVLTFPLMLNYPQCLAEKVQTIKVSTSENATKPIPVGGEVLPTNPTKTLILWFLTILKLTILILLPLQKILKQT